MPVKYSLTPKLLEKFRSIIDSGVDHEVLLADRSPRELSAYGRLLTHHARLLNAPYAVGLTDFDKLLVAKHNIPVHITTLIRPNLLTQLFLNPKVVVPNTTGRSRVVLSTIHEIKRLTPNKKVRMSQIGPDLHLSLENQHATDL
jgi:hypothetical protein